MTAEPSPEPTALTLAEDARPFLRSLYDDLDRTVADHAPVCRLSGRCCRFEEYGHTLFLSAAEAAVLVADAPPPVRALDTGATCPWQDDHGRCNAREARPIGCRVYFCDPRFEGEAPQITERFLSRLKATAAERGWPWDYAPLHRHLASAFASGAVRNPREAAEQAAVAPPGFEPPGPPGDQA